MANTPGSPPETMATLAPRAACASAARARAPSSRLSVGWRVWPGSRRDPIEVGPIAVKGVGLVERVERFAREVARIPGAEAHDGELAAHGRPSKPGTSTIAK